MLEVKGKYCKDIKVFTDNVEEEALSVLYHISEMKAYEGSKVRIMPDVHKGVGDTVIGFLAPFLLGYILFCFSDLIFCI